MQLNIYIRLSDEKVVRDNLQPSPSLYLTLVNTKHLHNTWAYNVGPAQWQRCWSNIDIV